jgi:hypothetical protein
MRRNLQHGVSGMFITAVVVLTIALGAAGIVAILSGDRGGTAGAAGSPDCTGAIPISKCVPAIGNTQTGQGAGAPLSVVPPVPFWPSATSVDCGTGFFTSTEEGAVVSHFGPITDCFRPSGSSTWVIVTSGTNGGGTATAIGGDIVALDLCASAAADCMSPNSTHQFGDFTVYYPPDPSSWPFRVDSLFGNALLTIEDGSCGQFSFDVSAPAWYGPESSQISSVLSGSDAGKVTAPIPVSGLTALASAAPTAIASSCNS